MFNGIYSGKMPELPFVQPLWGCVCFVKPLPRVPVVSLPAPAAIIIKALRASTECVMLSITTRTNSFVNTYFFSFDDIAEKSYLIKSYR